LSTSQFPTAAVSSYDAAQRLSRFRMSAKGQKQTMKASNANVRFVPIPDMLEFGSKPGTPLSIFSAPASAADAQFTGINPPRD
jgi:hypothetical protein